MLKLNEHGAVAEVSLNRPPVNAMNQQLVDELLATQKQLLNDGAAAVVISGSDGVFSAGLDVRELLAQDRAGVLQFWNSFFALMSALACSPVPVAAAMTGHAPAGGAVLALHCDYRVATRGDYKIGLNEVQVGLPVPASILFMLEQVVGARQAMLLAATGTMLSPDAALEIGFVDELADQGHAVTAAVAWCDKLLALPQQAMNTTRQLAKAAVIQRAQENESYAATATDYWFGDETQATMRALVANLDAKSSSK
jgi:3,2-trans-enoyl-CoA isomerase